MMHDARNRRGTAVVGRQRRLGSGMTGEAAAVSNYKSRPSPTCSQCLLRPDRPHPTLITRCGCNCQTANMSACHTSSASG